MNKLCRGFDRQEGSLKLLSSGCEYGDDNCPTSTALIANKDSILKSVSSPHCQMQEQVSLLAGVKTVVAVWSLGPPHPKSLSWINYHI